jgi:nucleotide-binding universal stress UspA family protein
LEVVHVVHWSPRGPHLVPGTGKAEQELTVRTHAETLLADIGDELRKSWPELSVRSRVESGRTGETLARVAQQAEVLVIGSSGQGALPGVVLGSTAAEVVHTCDRPVVVSSATSMGSGTKFVTECAR